jgi:hypothetical protein
MISCSYENWYMQDAKLKSSEQVKDQIVMKPLEVKLTSNQEVKEVNKETKTSNSSHQQDLDAFLLGDTENSDDDPGTPYSICLLKSISFYLVHLHLHL